MSPPRIRRPRLPVMPYTGEVIPRQRFTCSRCTARGSCEYAWDLYNLDGDCLAVK